MRRTPLLFVTVAGLLLLSGCFKVDADFKVNADETVDGTMIVAIDKEFQEMLGSMGDGSTEDEDLITVDDMPEGTEIEEYDQGGFVGQKVSLYAHDLLLGGENQLSPDVPRPATSLIGLSSGSAPVRDVTVS